MDSFSDYYAVLGVKPNAPASTIKAAFKKLALQYHPDVYKGEDAQERMRILLRAYQTLSDSNSRKAYDAHRSEHFLDTPRARPVFHRVPPSSSEPGTSTDRPEVSPTARRDRQRYYDFPDLSGELPTQVNLGDLTYSLSPDKVRMLAQQGMLRGLALKGNPHHCHRCHHRWTSTAAIQPRTQSCPACKATDWAEYLLLRCVHCRAVFESEQIRDEIGLYNYGDRSLCPPYELFPLCPYCGVSGWCPAEDVRVSTLRAVAKRRAALLHLMWLSIVVVVVLVLAVVLVTVVR